MDSIKELTLKRLGELLVVSIRVFLLKLTPYLFLEFIFDQLAQKHY